MRQKQRHPDRPHGRGRAEQAKATSARMQNIHSINGKQGGGPSEQNGEEIER